MDAHQTALLREYHRNPPRVAVTVDEPWWFYIATGLSPLINGAFSPERIGPRVTVGDRLAIIARGQRLALYNGDVQAAEGILRAEGRVSLYAHQCPRGCGDRIVALVEVVGPVLLDSFAEFLWFSGPDAVQVQNPIMLNAQSRPRAIAAGSGDFSELEPDAINGLQNAIMDTIHRR